ncbi:hypothetical protein [Halobellus limi]|uniref:Uncharacterized protein n=1 Tax=Halobellus limi TaxID=699433 RepID=A0A1H5SQE1_9EURY|nr:hypothetical protein [Halobellus limi]QCC47539.1 hypothetical protein DV707_07610 [Halobellus limi]SEF52061.1 hypothetical protein SAMN04488133_0024 [Halobellus limi]
MPLPPIFADVNALALVGKLLAGGGVAAALFMLGRVLMRAQAIQTWLWLGAVIMFALAGMTAVGVVDVNIGRIVDGARLSWKVGNWIARNFGGLP